MPSSIPKALIITTRLYHPAPIKSSDGESGLILGSLVPRLPSKSRAPVGCARAKRRPGSPEDSEESAESRPRPSAQRLSLIRRRTRVASRLPRSRVHAGDRPRPSSPAPQPRHASLVAAEAGAGAGQERGSDPWCGSGGERERERERGPATAPHLAAGSLHGRRISTSRMSASTWRAILSAAGPRSFLRAATTASAVARLRPSRRSL